MLDFIFIFIKSESILLKTMQSMDFLLILAIIQLIYFGHLYFTQFTNYF